IKSLFLVGTEKRKPSPWIRKIKLPNTSLIQSKTGFIMRIKNIYSALWIFGLFSLSIQLQAQELNARVEVNVTGSGEISNIDKNVWTALQTQCNTFLNSTKWTGDVFESVEKIECNFLFNFKSMPSAN